MLGVVGMNLPKLVHEVFSGPLQFLYVNQSTMSLFGSGVFDRLGHGTLVAGLLHAVAHLAAELDVDETLAVGTSFDANGDYAGFDEASPLAKSGGKSDVLEELAARTGSDAIAFIGDGATDLEAAHRAARFIAFGGVVRRDNVFEAAAVTCESADFRDLVPLLMTPAEIARLKVAPDHAALVAAAPHPTPHSD